MANIPIPQQGQPIDYSYIYQIVNTLNDISTKLSANSSNSRIGSKDLTTEIKRTNDISVVALYKEVTSSAKVTETYEEKFDIKFNMSFKNPPIVTATPQVISGQAGKDVSVVIDKINNENVTGWIAFNSKGTTTVGVNIIAVGIPNS